MNEMELEMRVFSNGGGVQSTAALVLSATKEIDFPTHLFANTGDDSENPDTLDYVRNVAMPYAKAHGIEMVEVSKSGKTLYQHLIDPDSRSVGIPVRMGGSGAPGRRQCTTDYKIRVVSRWLKKHGANKSNLATVGMGISIDEYQRMRTDDPREPHIHKEYPLIDLHYSRQDCIGIIREANLPVPPKSSCWFCPYHSLTAWGDLKREKPELFAKASELETTLNLRRTKLGKDFVWFTSRLKPLASVIGDQPRLLDIEDTCESGYCMT